MSVTIARKSRKARRCDGCGRGGKIKPGDVYLSHVIFPHDDYSEWDKPVRSAECSDCAIRYGRAYQLAAAE